MRKIIVLIILLVSMFSYVSGASLVKDGNPEYLEIRSKISFRNIITIIHLDSVQSIILEGNSFIWVYLKGSERIRIDVDSKNIISLRVFREMIQKWKKYNKNRKK